MPMPSDVKGKLTIRDEQAARTRQRILRAAAAVFVEQGFAASRIDDVAAEAGVAVPTVYKVFANKRNLLVGALELAMRGEDGDGPLDQQSWFTEQLAEPDPIRQLGLIARNARRMYERAGALLDVLRAAAPGEPELATAWEDISAQRAERSRQTAADLMKKAKPRLRLSRDDIAITLATLTEPELFVTFTRAGRSADAYERWLADILDRTILS
jgi:AcrR family transcriptional regulator